MNVVRVLKTPEDALKLVSRGALVGIRTEGDKEVSPAGVITKVSPSGKTVKTSKNIVFKFRRSLEKFTLQGELDQDCVVLSSKGNEDEIKEELRKAAVRAEREDKEKRKQLRSYMRVYMSKRLAAMSPEEKEKRAEYLREYSRKYYQAKKRRNAEVA